MSSLKPPELFTEEHQYTRWRGRRHRRLSAARPKQRHLPEEVTRPKRRNITAARSDRNLALTKHEERITGRPLTDEANTSGDILHLKPTRQLLKIRVAQRPKDRNHRQIRKRRRRHSSKSSPDRPHTPLSGLAGSTQSVQTAQPPTSPAVNQP